MAGMSRAVLNEVKRLKPSGRPSRSDIKRAREMLKKRKGKQYGNDSSEKTNEI